MNAELKPDFSLEGEDAIFEEMIKLTVDQMEESEDGIPLRVQHAKATGCVTGTFEIERSLPVDLQHGVFRELGRRFEAIVRFSNAQGTIQADGEGTARGMAIKLLDVSGNRAMEGDSERTQDFLMVDHPVFPFPNPKEYLDVIKRKSTPLIGGLWVLAHLGVFDRDQLAIVKAIRGQRVASPLATTYWSGSPYWLGAAEELSGCAVKYSAVPPTTKEGPEDPEEMPPNYLREAISRQLAANEATFEFKVQKQADEVSMPIENASVEWDESQSQPITVATLRIGTQSVDAHGDLEKQCESMSFNPWHALKEHRPLGGINRLRKAVYEASFTERQRRKKRA